MKILGNSGGNVFLKGCKNYPQPPSVDGQAKTHLPLTNNQSLLINVNSKAYFLHDNT